MRNLVILVGAPGCGKSTWLEQNQLTEYSLSPDTFRLLHASIEQTVDGDFGIPQFVSKDAWNMTFDLLEKRMKNGHFTIVDGTNTKSQYFAKYKKLAEKYRYRLWYKKFDVPLPTLLERNLNRGYKSVPSEVVERFYEQLKTLKIPKAFNEIDHINDSMEIVKYEDVSEKYESVYYIGDIHGVKAPLVKFIDDHYNQNSLYIFVGDYIDRGNENAEVLRELLALDKSNCIFLEGNHEIWLKKWGNNLDDEIRSKQFLGATIDDFTKNEFTRTDAREFCRYLQLFSAIEFHGKKILATHGGVANPIIDYIPSVQLIKGVGNYSDYLKVAESFYKHSEKNEYQVFGHRNTEGSPIKLNDRVYNLNGDIELKGNLRVVKFTEDDIETFEYPSDYMFKHTKKLPKNIDKITEELLVNVLRNNDNVNERKHGNISSFNFNKKVFFDRIWNDQTVKARGLFINTNTNNIVARSYNKFFNIGERRETELVNLKHTMQFPLVAYEKENGFLGILGYDRESERVLYCSKATLDNDYAGYFKTLVEPYVSNVGIMSLLKSGHSLVFEVIDIENDPHIIEHKKSKVILLDIIKNTVNHSHLKYHKLKNVGDMIGVKTKTLKETFQSWGEFTSFLDKVKNHKTEGFVFEDANGFMVKYKTNFYNQWKHSRMLVDKIKKGESINLKDCVNIEENLFINFIENTYRNNLDELQDKSIIELRKEFKNQNN